MKALVYTGPKALDYRDAPEPLPVDGQVLVDVASVGICGSDMHAFLGHDARRPAPLILGHEAAGTVRGTTRRVTVNPLVHCGTCPACTEGRENLCGARKILSMPPREGAFAQTVLTPPENLVDVPDHVDLDRAALAEPLACGWHLVRLSAAALYRPLDQARCVVIGGGAIGLGIALILRAWGARDIRVSEPNLLRHEALKAEDGIVPVLPDEVDADSADLVADAVGLPATRAAASACVRPGGVIAHIGLGHGEGGLDTRFMTLQEVTFIGTYCYTMDDFRETAKAIFDGRLGALDWTETRDLSDGQAAFDAILSNTVRAPKIVLHP